jgi:dipeptidyl aminopeptidase/acylaminoacyl peptidase
MFFRRFLVVCMAAASIIAAERAFSPPPALKTDGVPAIPATLAEDLAQYTESRSAVLADWHPTRREILIHTRFGNTVQVHRVAFPGGARTQQTFYPERAVQARANPAGGDSFLFTKDTGGGEWFQVFRFDPETGRSTMLTDGQSRNEGYRWAESGRQIAFTSAGRGTAERTISVMDPANPGSKRVVLKERGAWGVDDWSGDEKSLLIGNYKSINDAALYKVDVATGSKTLLSPDRPGVYYADAEFAPGDRGIYLVTNEDSEFKRLGWMDVDTKRLTLLRPDINWDIQEVALSKDGKRLAYVANEDGTSVLRVLDTASKRDVQLPRLPLGLVGTLRWQNNNRELGFTFNSAKSPSDVYSINVESGKLERWTFSETGGLNPSTFPEPELIRWKSFDGRMISGFYYPAAKKFTGPRPVVINIHGGPEGQALPMFQAQTNYLMTELGVALIFPNVRGSSGYGRTFLDLDNGVKREDSVRDIGALLDWIASQPALDAGRVMVTGGSYGGYMTLASMTHYNDRLRCAADVVGISNWVTFLQNTEEYRRDLRRVEYGDERDPKMRDFLISASPITNVKKITRPMMIVQGKNDPRVPWTESEQMVKAIRANGGTVWYLLAEDEGHGFAKKANRDYQFAAFVMFVREYLVK